MIILFGWGVFFLVMWLLIKEAELDTEIPATSILGELLDEDEEEAENPEDRTSIFLS